jgi:hypothetical protein
MSHQSATWEQNPKIEHLSQAARVNNLGLFKCLSVASLSEPIGRVKKREGASEVGVERSETSRSKTDRASLIWFSPLPTTYKGAQATGHYCLNRLPKSRPSWAVLLFPPPPKSRLFGQPYLYLLPPQGGKRFATEFI